MAPNQRELKSTLVRVSIQNLEHLLLVRTGVSLNLLRRKARARNVAARRITNHSSEVTDQEHHVVAELLELPHLVDEHRMPEMQVRCRRIEARLDQEWTPRGPASWSGQIQ